jgi:hypothetical protein
MIGGPAEIAPLRIRMLHCGEELRHKPMKLDPSI